MSMKKLITAGIAAAAAASVALSAGAVNLGYSDKDVEFYMSGDEEVVVSAQVDFPENGMVMYDVSAVFEARIPADALEEGAYTFRVVTLDEEGDRKKVDNAIRLYTNYGSETEINMAMFAFDLCFFDENGASVSPENVKIYMKNLYLGVFCDVFIEESDGSLTRLDHNEDADGISFIPPHFSKFIVAEYEFLPIAPPPVYDAEAVTMPETDDDTNKDHTDGTNSEPVSETTDTSKPLPKPDDKGANTGDSAATAVVFGIMGLAALGTAIVASKSKKAHR